MKCQRMWLSATMDLRCRCDFAWPACCGCVGGREFVSRYQGAKADGLRLGSGVKVAAIWALIILAVTVLITALLRAV